MALYHVYNQTVADGTATSVVRPSDWNSAHSQVMTIAGNTVGASTVSGTNLVFQGGNNVTLSINQGANVGTMVVSAANQTVQTQASGNIVGAGYTSTTQAGSTVGITQNSNGLSAAWPLFITTAPAAQTTQTQPAGNIAGAGYTSTTQAGSTVGVTQNSNGLSAAWPLFLTTAAQSNHSHNFATTTTNGSQIVVGTANSAGATIGVPPFITTFTQPGATVFSNSNNVSFGLNGSTVTATATFAQSAQTANLYANGNTTQLSSTAGVDVRSLSFEGAGIASVGVSNGRVLVSVPAGGGGGDGYNIVQMGTGTVDGGGTSGATFSTLSGSIYLQAGNNMTLSQTSNTINISGADVKWQLVGANTAGTTSSNLSANQFYLSGGNNVTLSGNSNTIVVSAAAGGGGGGTTVSWYPPLPLPVATSTMVSGTSGNTGGSFQTTAALYIGPMQLNQALSFGEVELIASHAALSAGTGSITLGHSVGIYSLNAGTALSLVSSFQWQVNLSQNSATAITAQFWWGTNSTSNSTGITGNSSASVTGPRVIKLYDSTGSLPPGDYWIAQAMTHRSSSVNIASGWFTGAFLSQSQSTMGVSYFGNSTVGAIMRHIGSVTTTQNNANSLVFQMPTSIHTSAITYTGGTSQQRVPNVRFYV